MTKVNDIDGWYREDNFLGMVADNLHDSWRYLVLFPFFLFESLPQGRKKSASAYFLYLPLHVKSKKGDIPQWNESLPNNWWQPLAGQGLQNLAIIYGMGFLLWRKWIYAIPVRHISSQEAQAEWQRLEEGIWHTRWMQEHIHMYLHGTCRLS